jgi:predicted metal-binding protein
LFRPSCSLLRAATGLSLEITGRTWHIFSKADAARVKIYQFQPWHKPIFQEENLMVNKEQLGELFAKHGFDDFRWIRSADIQVAQWVRFKCLFGCPNYGQSGTCPPNIPDIDQCRQFFSEYQEAAVIHLQKTVEEREEYRQWSRDTKQRLFELEREIFLAGYYKAFLVSHDACGRCEDCVAHREGCKNPRMARPGADAMGIDVYATVRSVGYPIQVLKDYEETMNRYAFLMVE